MYGLRRVVDGDLARSKHQGLSQYNLDRSTKEEYDTC